MRYLSNKKVPRDHTGVSKVEILLVSDKLKFP